jgi:hypothetical protein
VFLLTGDTSYAHPVRLELVNQIAQAGTNWANTSKWCVNQLSHTNTLETIPWIYRLLLAYDYLQAGGYTGFSATEKTNIDTWFRSAASLWNQGHRNGVNNGAYPGIYANPQNLTCVGSNCTTSAALLYFQGPTAHTAHNGLNNVGTISPLLSMAVGTKMHDAPQLQDAIAWLTAFLKVGIWDNGAIQDFTRWRDCTPSCPGSMWAHTGGVWGPVTAAIDILARNGDPSLYTLSGPTQVLRGSGGTVSWQTVLHLAAQMANKTVSLYGTTSAGSVGPATLLSWDTGTPDKGQYYDFSSMAANLFYNNSTIQTAMTRNLLTRNHNVTGCYDAQYGGCFSGVWSFWPDLPFMYGNMEGKVNPYRVSSGPSVSLTESPSSITSGQSSTLSWSSSNVTSCTASGGWSETKPTSGTQVVAPTQTTTYTLSCTGSGGSATQSTTVTVLPPTIPQSSLTIQSVDSEDIGYEATRAIDLDPTTMWHTKWRTAASPPPHTIVLNLNNIYVVTGIGYTPRTDGEPYGTIKNYEVYTSPDNVSWTLVASGTFASDTTPKDVTFSSQSAKYIKLRALSEINGGPWTSAAKINVYGTQIGLGPGAPANMRILSVQ